MTKTLIYPTFALASVIVIVLFVTAKTYPQLIAAAVLYPALIFLAFKIFLRKGTRPSEITMHLPAELNPNRVETTKPKTEPAYVADIDRRTFIKLIGATGISFFLFSILGRRTESLFFGRTEQLAAGTNAIGNNNQFGLAGSSPTDGYKISEVDEGSVSYYGFIGKDGAWLIMREETNEGSFRYAKGSSDFPANWANRENLKYDYFYNLP